MTILLVGEYSRLHNSLKEGLLVLGHDVTIVGTGDGFKNYPIDIPIKKKYEHGVKKLLKKVLHRLFKIDIESFNIRKQILRLKPELSNFDIVQFINEASFGCTPKIEKEIFDNLCSWNDDAFLLCCGSDYISTTYAHSNKLKYSFLTPYLSKKDVANEDSYGLKFLTPSFKALHEHIYSKINGVIASDIDYHIPLKDHPKYLGLVPNPINIDELSFKSAKIKDSITIFHGINEQNYFRKGNDFFEKALQIIQKKFPQKVKVLTVKSLPYSEYIDTYRSAHILMDMVYAYDQGYNALEAMAQGKVVFTGAEQEWLEYYKLSEDEVAINAVPNVEAIVKKLIWLIENPKKIEEISINARQFIERHHNYISCAEHYLNYWNNNRTN